MASDKRSASVRMSGLRGRAPKIELRAENADLSSGFGVLRSAGRTEGALPFRPIERSRLAAMLFIFESNFLGDFAGLSLLMLASWRFSTVLFSRPSKMLPT